MKVLWTHNFNPAIPGSGIFMHNMVNKLKSFDLDVELKYLGSLNSFERILSAREDLRSYSRNYDLVHSQFGSACAFVSTASEVPSVLSLRGSDWHCYLGTDLKESFHGILANTLSRISIPYFDAIITMSSRMSDGVRKFRPNALLETIPDPLDIDLFMPMKRSEARRRLFGTNSTAPWILFTSLSSNNPVKRVSLAREAVSIAAQSIPDLELKVATGIPYSKMPLFINSCDLVLCTSTHEGWPNSVKEALACGLPFISTDVSDLRTISLRHKNCIIAPSDPVKLAEMIVKSLPIQSDPTLRNEVDNMTFESSCSRLSSLYASLLNRS
jgi:glycosyltransferase involved in cell wall biosynthesis